MPRLLVFLLLAVTAFAANIRLYLKDGTYQFAREYEVQGDRVRFYSVELRDWDEVPLELVDLKRTEAEVKAKKEAEAVVIREEKAEDEAIRADKKQVASVPEAPGAYLVDGEHMKALVEAKAFNREAATNKILQKVISAPIIAGKTTVTIDEKASKFRLTDPNPEFFFRLAMPERVDIVRLDPKKNDRIVQTAMIVPNGEGVDENYKVIATFKKQYGETLLRVWPEKPLEPGEYALIEYTGGEINARVWDFAIDKNGDKK